MGGKDSKPLSLSYEEAVKRGKSEIYRKRISLKKEVGVAAMVISRLNETN